MNFTDFLVWLTSGGSIIAISWIFEQWAFFQAQTANAKRWMLYGASAALSLAAYSVTTYVPAAIVAQIAPIFAILSATFATIFLGQLYHTLAKKNAPENAG